LLRSARNDDRAIWIAAYFAFGSWQQRRLFLAVDFECGDKGLLGNLHLPELPHLFLAGFL
jgi:hypothetical protein